ncbi:UNVERIFIED_CONTAM: hypothetical protein Sradi_0695000 [Sesamum radiatum]|uniref:Uncharacterized protein n=1 Tax=Sesamum radiatum TaxID=300843 RepID=A0AAW2VMN6_SESRA
MLGEVSTSKKIKKARRWKKNSNTKGPVPTGKLVVKALIVGKGNIKEVPKANTDCGAHICNDLQVTARNKRLSKGEIDLQLGNGKRVIAEAVGLVHLIWTPPEMPKLNGISKRRNRTLLDMVRFMMSFTELPLSGLRFEMKIKLLNMASSKIVAKTSCEMWHGKPASYKYLKSSEATPQATIVSSFMPVVPSENISILRRSTRVSQLPERYGLLMIVKGSSGPSREMKRNGSGKIKT